MSAHCHTRSHTHSHPDRGHSHRHAGAAAATPAYRRVLWIALAVNAAMFGVDVAASAHTGSVALLADAIDFMADTANYALSLAVLSLGLLWRARAAAFKGLTMVGLGVLVIGRTLAAALAGLPPAPVPMGAVGLLALLANTGVALLLYAWREGDANMRSVWLCTRNDAIGNLTVVAAALGVFGTGSVWPDLLVAAAMGVLAISSGLAVVRLARADMRAATAR